jgi:membrane protein DedA with SNARE-associated domain
MDLWVSFWSGLTSSIAEHGLLTVAILVMVKSAGVPLPVPADLLIVIVGANARDAGDPLWPAWLVLSAATAVGASVLYEFARRLGAEDIVHYGHYVGLTPDRVNDARRRTRDHRAIFVARIVPGLRLAIVVVCAILLIPRRVVTPAVCLAALVYVGACLALGYIFGQRLAETLAQFVFPAGLVIPSVAVAALLVWLKRARRVLGTASATVTVSRASRIRAGALAGAVAVGGSSMLANVCIYVGGPLISDALASPLDFMTRGRADPDPLEYLLGVSVFAVVLGVLGGAIYGIAADPWVPGWPDWLRGMVFATLPLIGALLLLVVMAVGRGGEPQQTWILAVVGEALRWAIYGVFLGLVNPVLRARRASATAPRPMAAPEVVRNTNVI